VAPGRVGSELLLRLTDWKERALNPRSRGAGSGLSTAEGSAACLRPTLRGASPVGSGHRNRNDHRGRVDELHDGFHTAHLTIGAAFARATTLLKVHLLGGRPELFSGFALPVGSRSARTSHAARLRSAFACPLAYVHIRPDHAGRSVAAWRSATGPATWLRAMIRSAPACVGAASGVMWAVPVM